VPCKNNELGLKIHFSDLDFWIDSIRRYNYFQALSEAGVAADVEKVTDMMKIASDGVLGTPAVVADGEVKSEGKIPNKEDVKSWLQK